MSTSVNLWGFNFVIRPRFDFLLKLSNGSSLMFKDYYMKYVVLFSLLYSLRLIYKALNHFRYYYSKFLLKISPVKANKNNYIVILGFGDNYISSKLVEYFGKLGYKFILVCEKKIQEVRKKYMLNNLENIGEYDNLISDFTYEGIMVDGSLEKVFVSENSESVKIDYIFDTSVLRIYSENLTDEEAKEHHSFYFNEQISAKLKKIMQILDILKVFFNKETVMFVFDYIDKEDEVNHKLFYDLKNKLYQNYSIIKQDQFKVKYVRCHNESGVSKMDLDKIHRMAKYYKLIDNFTFT